MKVTKRRAVFCWSIVVLAAATAAFGFAGVASAADFPSPHPRNDAPSRPGTIVTNDYGPFTINAGSQIENAFTSVVAPCTNCRITDMVPELVDSVTGAPVNLGTTTRDQSGCTPTPCRKDALMMHHFLLVNQARQDLTCPTGMQGGLLTGERFFASGNERTHLHLPGNYGYENDSGSWVFVYHLVNKSDIQRSVKVRMMYRHRPKSETQQAVPAWLDIDSCGDSNYSIPAASGGNPQGYSDYHDVDNTPEASCPGPPSGPPGPAPCYTADWQIPWDARLLSIAGHQHDVDITGPNPCFPAPHCASSGGGIALSAELRGGPSNYFGPNPPNNPRPADLTGETLCRSQDYFGTSFGTAAWDGHLDTMSTCGIFTDVPAGAQAEAYPINGAYPANGLPVSQNQVIRLHSEYFNGTGAVQSDVMGIMNAWFTTPTPDYPRPGGGTPFRVPLVPGYNACTSPNATHTAPLALPSCDPPTQESGVLTVGNTGGSTGFAKYEVFCNGGAAGEQPPCNTTAGDQLDVRITGSVTDVRCRATNTACPGAPGSDYTGRVLLTSKIRMTDKLSSPGTKGTAQDANASAHFSAPMTCTATASTSVGGTCTVSTTIDALLPSFAVEQKRQVISVLGVNVRDAGPNGAGFTTGCPPTCGNGDETTFLQQGVFTP